MLCQKGPFDGIADAVANPSIEPAPAYGEDPGPDNRHEQESDDSVETSPAIAIYGARRQRAATNTPLLTVQASTRSFLELNVMPATIAASGSTVVHALSSRTGREDRP